MPAIKHHKLVSALPGTLEADSVYFVKAGSNVEIYVTNTTGTIVGYRAGVEIDRSKVFSAFNDFTSPPATAASDWVIATSGTGASATAISSSGTDAAGLLRLNLGTTATGRAGVGGGIATAMNTFRNPPQGEARFKTRLRRLVTSDATNAFDVYIGFRPVYTAAAGNSIAFNLSAGWLTPFASKSGGGVTETLGLVAAPALNEFHTYEIVASQSGAQFLIDDVLVATASLYGLPVSATDVFSYLVAGIRTAGTASLAILDIDYIDVTIDVVR